MKTQETQKKADLVRTRNALAYLKTHPVTRAVLIHVKSLAGINLPDEELSLSAMQVGPAPSAGILRDLLVKRMASLDKEWWEFWK